MRPIDPPLVDSAAIIPFSPRPSSQECETPADKVSTIVAIVAVTLRHEAELSPEEGLADLIEATGHAEIIEIQDACTEIFETANGADRHSCSAANDN